MDSGPKFEDYVIQQSEEAEECEHCLSSQCITCETNRQMWWLEEPEMANRSNAVSYTHLTLPTICSV